MNGTHTLRKHYKNVWFFLLKNSFLKGGGVFSNFQYVSFTIIIIRH